MGTVLVTGGAGYIGSHVCKLLAESGKRPVAYDNLVRGNRAAVRWGDLVVGDLSDGQLLRETIERQSIEAVIHLAAFAYVRESMCHADMYWRNNVLGTQTLLDAMKETGVRRIVFSSSCATYGVPSRMPIAVNCPQNPINPYGKTKLACEWMIRDYGQQGRWEYAILRYFNVAGNDPDQDIGEVHEPETHIIPSILLRALQPNPEPVRIFGGSHSTRDGTCVRDFIHVVDLASAHLKALEFIAAKRERVTFNVALGKGTSILELLKICEEVAERGIPYCLEDPHPGDPPCLIADPGDVWTTLGLHPRFTQTKTMVEHAWQWITQKRQLWCRLKTSEHEEGFHRLQVMDQRRRTSKTEVCMDVSVKKPYIKAALIPVAGNGTRLKPITSVIPKAMLPLVDSDGNILSVLHAIIRQVLLAGIERVGIIISPWQLEMFRQYFAAVKDQGWGNLSDVIEYIIQPTPRGFGDAVLRGSGFVGDQPFVVLLGDHIHVQDSGTPCCVEQVIEEFASWSGKAMVGVQPVCEDELSRVGISCGIPIGTSVYKCRRFVEKPSLSTARGCLVTEGLPADMFLAHCGIYVLSPEIFECLGRVDDTARGSSREVELADAQSLLLKAYPEEYFLCQIRGCAHDVGTPEGYAKAQSALRNMSVPFTVN